MFFELIYTSLPLQKDLDVLALLKGARKHNQDNNITGLLCFDGVRFLQILEGDETTVQNLYASIQVDPRHKGVELIHSGKTMERSFTSWSMAYENFPVGILEPLTENIGAMSMTQAADQIAQAGESFGARLFGLFFRSTYNVDANGTPA